MTFATTFKLSRLYSTITDVDKAYTAMAASIVACKKRDIYSCVRLYSFYYKYNSRSAKRQINPETGLKWARPGVQENISLKELVTGPALNDKKSDALVAFMKTLTDKRYEEMLD